MFTAIARDGSALGRPVGAATLKRIHATLRAALNGAVRTGLIACAVPKPCAGCDLLLYARRSC
jgi:hypothetical protein